jgi:hypothetical protein
MRRSFVRCFVTLALLAAPLGACDDNTATPLTPTPPAPTTETFAGTLSVNGAVTFPFVTASAGSVTATLKTLEPDSTVIIGLALGTWNGTACAILIPNDNASVNTVVLGTATTSTSLCTRVSDVGKLTAATNFSLEVVHP